MNCPNCGNEWDASKGPCAKCGFTTRMANYPEQTARSSPVASSAQSSTSRSVSHPLQPLLPGVSLRSGRYRLQEKLEQQNWQSLRLLQEKIWPSPSSQVRRLQPIRSQLCSILQPRVRVKKWLSCPHPRCFLRCAREMIFLSLQQYSWPCFWAHLS